MPTTSSTSCRSRPASATGRGRATRGVVPTPLRPPPPPAPGPCPPAPPPGRGGAAPPRPRLLAPPGAREAFAQVCSGAGMSADHLELAFDLSVYDPAQSLEIGGL